MKTMLVYGSSDDLIEVEWGNGYREEFYGYTNKGNDAGYFDVLTEAGSFRVHAVYDGCWAFAIGMTDEGARFLLPYHSVEAGDGEPAPGYSTLLRVSVPDEIHIEACPAWRE